MPEDDLVVVYSGDSISSGIIKGLLEDAGITAFLQDEFMGTIFPYLITGSGTGAVKVVIAKSDLEQANSIIQEFSSESPKD